MSRRRFLKMGAIVAALGFAGPTALAGSRSLAKAVKADSTNRGRKTTTQAEHSSKVAPNSRTVRAANRSDRFARFEKPIRAEARSVAAQPQRATERSARVAKSDRQPRLAERPTRVAQGNRSRRDSERTTQVARVEHSRPAVQRANRFAHIERASKQVDNTHIVAQAQPAPQVEIDERPLKSPVVQVERTSVVTPSTSFTRPAYPAQSDSSFSTPRSFVKMERHLELYNAHTGENLQTVYWAFGKYLPSALRDVNWLLRDHHSNDAIPMDPDLLDLLYNLSTTLEVRPSFQVISAYRSPATNAMLRMTSSGVAEHSQHIKGKAVDIRLPGTSLAVIRRAALSLQAGGVGYYPWSNFIHLDTGPVRSWLA